MLNIIMYQTNTKTFQVIKIVNLLRNPKVEVDSNNLSNNNQIKIFYILKKLNFFVL